MAKNENPETEKAQPFFYPPAQRARVLKLLFKDKLAVSDVAAREELPLHTVYRWRASELQRKQERKAVTKEANKKAEKLRAKLDLKPKPRKKPGRKPGRKSTASLIASPIAGLDHITSVRKALVTELERAETYVQKLRTAVEALSS